MTFEHSSCLLLAVYNEITLLTGKGPPSDVGLVYTTDLRADQSRAQNDYS